MAEGFRAAAAYVEITAELDENRVLIGARRAADGVDRELRAGGERAGRSLTAVLAQAGGDAGTAMAQRAALRLRDGRGRFVTAGIGISEDVIKGAADATDRGGLRAFLGLVKSAPKAGASAAAGLVESFGAAVKGPLGQALVVTGVAGAVVAGPLVGAALAGGIMVGVAGAGIGGAVALAAQDPKVKHAWTQAGDEIGSILRDSASPMKAELIDAASRGEAAFRRWEPMFDQIFGSSSQLLEPFVTMVERVGDRLLPTIMTTISAAGPAINALTAGVEGTVDAVADVIDSLGDNGPEAAAGLSAAFFIVQSSIRSAGLALNAMTEGFGLLIEGGLDVMGFLADVGGKLDGMPGPLGAIGEKMAGLAPVTDEWRAKWEGLKGQMTGATDAGSDGMEKLSERNKLLALSMGEAVQAAGSLSAAFRQLNGGALSAREAESAYQAAVDGVTASLRENGRTTDLNTAKGRANDAALRQLITTTGQKAQATYDETLATRGAAAAEVAAARTYEQGRAQLIKSAQAMGMSRAAAIAYADRLMAIPKSWSSVVTLNDQASGKAIAIKRYINNITGKTVTVRVIETREGYRMPGQGTLTRAEGGPITGGSGYRDDVPLLAMSGEWVIRKSAVRALERQFGAGFMSQLNNWGAGGKGGQAGLVLAGNRWRGLAARQDRAAAGPAPVAGPVTTMPIPPRQQPSVSIGQVVLDASGMKSIQDVVDMISGVGSTARSYRARTATV